MYFHSKIKHKLELMYTWDYAHHRNHKGLYTKFIGRYEYLLFNFW